MSDGPSMQNLGAEDEPIDIGTLTASARVEVIDLYTYQPKFCSCPMLKDNVVPSPPFRIVFGILATNPKVSRDVSTHELHNSVDAAEFPAREELRLYFAPCYRRLRHATLVARALARVSSRKAPRLLES